MKEYIEREALISEYDKAVKWLKDNSHNMSEQDYIERMAAMQTGKTMTEAIPAADVVPVVRCGECKHWHRCLSDDGKIEYFNFSHCEKGHYGFPNFFCADGEKKDGDKE